MILIIVRKVGILLLSLLMSAACSKAGADQRTPKLRLVVTTSILGDVVHNVVGDAAEVEVLIPNGVDPHDFVPSSQVVARMSAADLVVANGLGLEEGLNDVLLSVEGDGVSVLRVAEQVDPLDLDPHFWQDPIRMIAAVDVVSAQLSEKGPAGPADMAASYQSRIEAVNREVVSILSAIPPADRLLVTNHDAFRYFAARYGFEIIGVIVPGSADLSAPSSSDFAKLVRVVRQRQVPAIFVENIASDEYAKTLAAEVGRPVSIVRLISDALGEPGSETDSYLGLLRYNAKAIADGLG